MTEPNAPPGTAPGLHHIALRTADIEKTAAFYQKLFGLAPVRDERPRSLWLALGDHAVVMIEARGAGEPACPPGSLDLFALRVSAERKAEIRRLAMANDCYDGETAHTVYLRDPDGRRVGASTYPLD